jgi:EF-P beta-lysylation protein EpmB
MSLSWQAELSDSFTQIEDLLAFLELERHDFPEGLLVAERFPFRVPRGYARRMNKRDAFDPLLLQVIPRGEELWDQQGFVSDPVGDLQAVSIPGILQKYCGRALLITTAACAIHCRYCFRREFPYSGHALGRRQELAALAYIAEHPDIREVILSGGDPLVLNDERLRGMLDSIAAIPHVRRLRIHTRLPVVLPSRITAELVSALTRTRLPMVVVIHANHAYELNEEVREGLWRLRQGNIHLLNQSVLLRGVNDRVKDLIHLSETLFDYGVMPYYLHLLDQAKGTAHFEVSAVEARELHRLMRSELPGYLVPKLVREEAGKPFKIPMV